MKIKMKIKARDIVFLIIFIIVLSIPIINVKNYLKEKNAKDSVSIDGIISDASGEKGGTSSVAVADGKSKTDKIVVPGDAIAVVDIPSTGTRGKIKNGTDEETLKNYVGKFEGSAEPGQPGNFSIAAHNNIDTEIFRRLNKVVEGDNVRIITRDCEYVYRVYSIQTVNPDDIEVLKNTEKAEITLITCNTTASKRIVVKGVLVSQKATK
ncbi:MAG: class D sortase [Clostridia bacterium]